MNQKSKKLQKVMLITGTRKGIGRALAEYYLKHGFFVIGCSRNESDLVNSNYKHYILDIIDEVEVKKLFNELNNEHGRLDVLINNAGIASMNHSLLTSLTTVKNILNTNIVGNFLFTREAAKLMMKRKAGRIINFSTIAVPIKLEGEAIYAASKAAVNTLTQILAAEFALYNITVNAIGPTPMNTDLIKNVPSKKIEELIKRTLLKRLANFEDIQNLTDFFIKPESNFVTGQIVYLGGF